MPEGSSDAVMRRVLALLAKAESTEYPEEAEALLTKAQELMARHAIDGALLVARGDARPERVTTVSLFVEPPYARPKVLLLTAVAHANGCRVVSRGSVDGDGHEWRLFGFERDLHHVPTLFAALSMHATRSMLGTDAEGVSIRRFRHSFLLSYALRIGERLREASARAQDAAGVAAGVSTAVVLRDRSRDVDEAVAAQFPRLGRMRVSASSGHGWARGQAAADRAGLSKSVGSTPPAVLPRGGRGLAS